MVDQLRQLRKLTADDVEAVSFVNVTSYLEADKRSTQEQTNFDISAHMASNMMRWRGWLEAIEDKTSDNQVLGIFNDAGELDGYIHFGPHAKDPTKAEIHSLYVRPESWGQGTGSELFRNAARSLKDQGFNHLYVRTLRDDPIPNGFYRKIGFDLTPLFKRISGSSEVLYEMRLDTLDI